MELQQIAASTQRARVVDKGLRALLEVPVVVAEDAAARKRKRVHDNGAQDPRLQPNRDFVVRIASQMYLGSGISITDFLPVGYENMACVIDP